jgi:hypothetical protein
MSAFVAKEDGRSPPVRRRPASMDQKADGPTEDLVLVGRTKCGVILLRLVNTYEAPLFVRRPSSNHSRIPQPKLNSSNARPSLTEVYLTSIDDMSVRERGLFVSSSSSSYRWKKIDHMRCGIRHLTDSILFSIDSSTPGTELLLLLRIYP